MNKWSCKGVQNCVVGVQNGVVCVQNGIVGVQIGAVGVQNGSVYVPNGVVGVQNSGGASSVQLNMSDFNSSSLQVVRFVIQLTTCYIEHYSL